LVTGLRPTRHGIVSNTFWDARRAQQYAISDETAVRDGAWYGGEPIWVTAERQGMVAACFFWPGSEAAIKGVRPTFTRAYDGTVPNGVRVQTVIDWLQLPTKRRPHVITLYFSDTDTAGHDGPLDSRRVEEAARSVDIAIGSLLDGVDALPIHNRVNLLITSDHGMVETTLAQAVALDTLLGPENISEISRSFGGPVASLHVRGGMPRAAAIRDAINATLRHGRAYLRRELPARFHYRTNPRAGDVVVVMEESWTMRTSDRPESHPERRGMHGWDNGLPSMRATFLAMGPRIRRGATIGDVRNIDVYPLMTELLGLRGAPGIDGRAGRIWRVIRR
ncbi:MAG TPA: ectonucleotide pyrophosphatase/phosphodiesterase, partial [Plantibacter sp.]|uniref:alkaline phosphatase family protein n=1 Tax=Plantibacter sp. TaxID=1871045 RepID=UPI002BB8B236|nr:ectonucleotide pyrophosphatase/phosphodiesterase [Plantibacter sp.]